VSENWSSWLTSFYIILYTQTRWCFGVLPTHSVPVHRPLRGEVGFPGTFLTNLALDSSYDSMSYVNLFREWPNWARELEQTYERNPEECPPSQAAPACPNRGQRDSDDHLRSRWHSMRSDHLCSYVYIGRKSGKEFTDADALLQEGETLKLWVVRSPLWKNLVERPPCASCCVGNCARPGRGLPKEGK